MSIPGNMKDLVDKPFALDLDDATVLDGDNVLKLPNARNCFILSHTNNETVASIRTQKRPGRVIRFINGTSGANAVTFTDTTFGDLAEGTITTDGNAISVGDVKELQQLESGGWVQISGSNN